MAWYRGIPTVIGGGGAVVEILQGTGQGMEYVPDKGLGDNFWRPNFQKGSSLVRRYLPMNS